MTDTIVLLATAFLTAMGLLLAHEKVVKLAPVKIKVKPTQRRR